MEKVCILKVGACSFDNISKDIAYIFKQEGISVDIIPLELQLRMPSLANLVKYDAILYILPIGQPFLSNVSKIVTSFRHVKHILYITQEGDNLYNLLNRMQLQNISKHASIVACSNYVKDLIERHGIVVDKVIRHAIPKAYFRNAKPIEHELAEKFKGKKIILTDASEVSRKSWDLGLKAIMHCVNLYKENGKELDFVYIAHTNANLKQYSEFWDLQKLGVLYHTYSYGKWEFEYLLSLYKKIHVYFVTSTSEGYCIPAYISYIYNKPIVATELPPLRELYGHDVAYFVKQTKIISKQNEHGFLCDYYIYNPTEMGLALYIALQNSKKYLQKTNLLKGKEKFYAEDEYKKFIDLMVS